MRALCVAFVVSWLCACPAPSGNDGGTGGGIAFGGGTGSTGGGTGSGETVDSFCTFLNGAQGGCAAAAACGLYSDAQQCQTYLASHGGDGFDACAYARTGVDSGVLLFNAQAAAECKASYLQCELSTSACAQVLTGSAGNGADCESKWPCQTGYYCAGDGTCPGHCAPQQPGGAVVHYAGACADSTYAKYEFLADGGSQYVCTAKTALGHACTQSTECAAPAFCDPVSGLCQPPGAEGAACPMAAEFSSWCTPALSLSCQPQADGGAQCAPRAKRGEPCGFCVADLRCVITDGGAFGVCGDLAAQGEPCRDATECVTGTLTCEGGQCVPLPGEGGSCNDSSRCAAGLTCRYAFVDGGFSSSCQYYDAGTAPTCPNTESP